MADNSKKTIVALSVCSLLLVAMVVALTIGTSNNDTEDVGNNKDVTASKKAINTICQTTSYQQTCVESLTSSAGNSTDAKELIQAAFQVTIKQIHEAIENSTVIEKLQEDPRARMALDNCRELAQRAIDDLKRSFNKFGSFEFNNLNHWIDDLKIWLSGAITYQETCLDGFDDINGDAGEQMRQALNSSMELTSNALSMITEISSVFTSLDFEGFTNRRRLLFDESPVLGHGNELLPEWVDIRARRLLAAKLHEIEPDLVVAKDGSGKYKSINRALKKIPKNTNETFVLYIKEGVYKEKVQFNRSMMHLVVIGDGPTKTRITGNLNYIDGTPTYHTATVAVLGDYFIAKDIGFENSAGAEKHQAVALRVGADKSIFYNCHMDGYQDTLYAHTYRQFYRDCVITGTIDFVFGDSAAVFQNCTFAVRKPLDNQQCIVTAQGRKDPRQPTGLVLQNCNIVPDSSYNATGKTKSYLGRPWKEYSRTIIMESSIDDFIQPEGWLPWNGTFALDTLFYAEFNNRGPASSKAQRVAWPGVKELPVNRVERFTAAKFLEGDSWIPSTGVPYKSGFFFPPPKQDASVKYSPVLAEETKDLGKASTPAAAPVASTKSSPVASPMASPVAAPVETPMTYRSIAEPPTGTETTPGQAPASAPVSAPKHVKIWPFSFFSGARE